MLWEPPEDWHKRFSMTKDITTTTMKQAWGAEMWYSQGSHSWVSDPRMGGISQSQRSSPRSKETELHFRLPGPGAPKGKNENTWLQQPMGFTVRRFRKLKETDISLLKGSFKSSHAISLRAEAIVWKEAYSYLLANLGEPPSETGGNWDTPWRWRCWRQPFWGAYLITVTLVLERAILEYSFNLSAPGTWPLPTVAWHPHTLSGYSKSSSKSKAYSNASLPQEIRKISST